MSAILVDPQKSRAHCARLCYAGNTLMLKPATRIEELCEFAWQMIQEAFFPLHPEQAQSEMPVTKFFRNHFAAEARFTHSPEASDS